MLFRRDTTWPITHSCGTAYFLQHLPKQWLVTWQTSSYSSTNSRILKEILSSAGKWYQIQPANRKNRKMLIAFTFIVFKWSNVLLQYSWIACWLKALTVFCLLRVQQTVTNTVLVMNLYLCQILKTEWKSSLRKKISRIRLKPSCYFSKMRCLLFHLWKSNTTYLHGITKVQLFNFVSVTLYQAFILSQN